MKNKDKKKKGKKCDEMMDEKPKGFVPFKKKKK